MVVAVALVAYTPATVKSAHRELDKLSAQHGIEDELVALVEGHRVTLACGPVGVPNHAPIPLLALYLKTSPARIVSPEAGQIRRGVYLAASPRALKDYVLDPHDPHLAGGPAGGLHAGPGRIARGGCSSAARLESSRARDPREQRRERTRRGGRERTVHPPLLRLTPRRLSSPGTPTRELPLRLAVIA